MPASILHLNRSLKLIKMNIKLFKNFICEKLEQRLIQHVLKNVI